MSENHIPGMVLAVYKGGRVQKFGTYGFADLEQRTPVRRNTLFEICSISKQFTAVSVLLLAEDGKLSLDDSLAKFVPEVPKSWAAITVRDLMQHVSGIGEQVSDDIYLKPFDQVAKGFGSLVLPKPREEWTYSNAGYWFLAKVIEKASGMAYYSFMQKRIFDPLGMKDTHPNGMATVIEHRARGYRWDEASKRNQNAPMLTDVMGFGSGGLISTADDLNQWSEALKHDRILKPASRRQMLIPAVLEGGDPAWAEGMSTVGYGLGVFLSGSLPHRIEKHSGGWADASAQLTRFLDDDVTVVMLTNIGVWDARPWVGEVIGTMVIRDYKLPEWNPAPDPEPELLVAVQGIVDSVVAKKLVTGLLTDAAMKDLAADPEGAASEFKKLGVAGAKFVRKVPQGKRSFTLYLEAGSKSVILCVERDAMGKVNSISQYAIPANSGSRM